MVGARSTLLRLPALTGRYANFRDSRAFARDIRAALRLSRLCRVRFHSMIFPRYSVPKSAITSEPMLLRLITLISAVRSCREIRLRASANCRPEVIDMQLAEAQCGKNQGNESTAKGKTRKARDMNYKVIGFRKGKKVGPLRDHTGKVMVFTTRKEAETAAGIESMQIENLGIGCKIIQVKAKAGKK